LVFEPENNNKSLGKILFYKKLSEITIQFEEVYCLSNYKINKKLKLIISDTKKKLLFKEDDKSNDINEEIRIVESEYINDSKNINQQKLRKSINKKDLKITNKNQENTNINQNSIKNIDIIDNPCVTKDKEKKNDICYKFEFLFINTNENKDNIQIEYEYFKKMELKKLVLLKKEYKNIISPYFLLFNRLNGIDVNKYSLDENKDEINKLIEYNEKLFQKYFRRINNIEKIILNNAIKNIIFLCSEMTSCLINDDDTIINFYVEKLKKYSNIKL
jgi:hypothetical protein